MVLVGIVTGAILAAVALFIPWLPSAASRQAGQIDSVYWLVTAICIVIFAIVAGVSVYAVWKFRAPPDDWEDGSPIHGHTRLEVVWTAVPLVLVTAISIYSGIVLTETEDVPLDHPKVDVTAQQFAWSFSYPNMNIMSGNLVLPVNREVELDLTAKDVIHSFWVPQWRVKQDTVPGIHTHIVVTPTKIGTFPIICTELCGLGHAAMRSQAVVLSRADYAKWVDQQKKGGGAASAGGSQTSDPKAIFTSTSIGCANCHTLAAAGTHGQVGPDLDKVLPGKGADFIRQSIVDPNAEIAKGYQPNIMPGDFEQKLSKPQLDALVQFLVKSAGKS
jgi:cytochrome c oxidase subunit 2